VLGFMRPDRAKEVITGRYREVLIDGAGHWLQQEKPDHVNELLLDFLSSLKTGAER
jgi:pimeloyl-ACP methyl ester carboxylesterase